MAQIYTTPITTEFFAYEAATRHARGVTETSGGSLKAGRPWGWSCAQEIRHRQAPKTPLDAATRTARFSSVTGISSVLLLLLAPAALATTVEFKQQTITIPSELKGWLTSHLADVDGDGLTDLLALLPAQKELRVYRQRKSGFSATPDQTIVLPDQTAWVAMRDVEPHAGRELVISTATGLVYLRQDGGTLESTPRTLIEASQVFTADRLRIVTDPPGGPDAGEVLPVIFADRAVLYEKDAAYAWHPARTVDLRPRETTWQVRDEYRMTGPTPALTLEVRQTIRAGPNEGRTQEKDDEKAATWAQIAKLVKDAQWRHYGVQQQDVNGDGRKDLVLWCAQGDLNPATTIQILLRGANGRLPEQPSQVLRHGGLPIRVDRRLGDSPFWDLDGDGRCELILVALKTRVTSWSSIVNMVVSGGVDWVFTVRSGRNGAYAGRPDFQMDITSMTPHNTMISNLFLIDGDFNGDGREDILVERATEQFDVYLSSPRAGSFQPGPALRLAAPTEARRVETADLNGDGISDLFVQKALEAQITIHLSQPDPQKGTPK